MVKRMSDYSRRKELAQVREGFVDMETGEIVNLAAFAQLEAHFPAPWANFRMELEWRLKMDDPTILRTELQRLGTYPADALEAVKPLFVSRAPQRRNDGAVHKETIYAQPMRLQKQGGVTQKVRVENLSLKDVDKLVEPHRNEKFYVALKKWLETRDANEKRAKEIEAGAGRGNEKRALTTAEKLEIEALRALPRKPTNDGTTGAIVRSVTLEIGKLSGIPIRGGIAKNDTMLRVDVFTKAGKFHLIPVYVHHRVAGLPNMAIAAHKDEQDWTLIDDTFPFLFSLYPNDLLRINQRNASFLGYYAGCDRASGNVNLWAHDRNQAVGKDGLMRGIGIKTAESVVKFDVDVMGNIFPAKPETRHGLA